jgi:PAS domain S-box-containing protein
LKADLNMIDFFKKFSDNCKEAMIFIEFNSFDICHINQRGLDFFHINDDFISNENYFNLFKFNFTANLDIIKSNVQKACLDKGYYEKKSSVQFLNGVTAFCNFHYTLVEEDDDNKYFILKIINISSHKEHQLNFYNSLAVGVISHSNEYIKFTNSSFNKDIKVPELDFHKKSIYTLFSNLTPETLEKSFDADNEIEVRVKSEITTIPKKYSIRTFADPINNNNISLLYDLNLEDQLKSQTIKADLANQANILLEREVIKHKETQHALNHSQEISKSLFNSSIDTIISSNLDGLITEISPSAVDLFGYTNEELLGKSIDCLYHDSIEYDRIAEELKINGSFSGEILNTDKNNRIFTTFLSCSTVKNNEGEIIGYMGISRDISENKESQKRLIESEKKFRDLFTYLSDGVLVLDTDNNINEYNIAAQELLPIEEGKKNNLFDFIHENDKDKFKQESLDFRKKGSVTNIEFAINGRNNKIKQILLSSTAIYENDNFVGSTDIIRDITNQKITEKLVENQNSKLHSIFENESDILIWTLDTNYRFTSKNSNVDRFFKRHFGIDIKIGDNLIHKILKPLISEKILNKLITLYEDAITGVPIQFEGLLKNKETGKSFWLETFLSPSSQIDNGKSELTGIAIDISEKKLSEIELTRSVEEKEILLKEVHHRVKNNLQVISSILNLQSSYVKDNATLNILRESQNRVKSMSYIHEILYRSKDFSEVNFTDYINNLTNSVLHTFLSINQDIFLELELDQVNLNLDQAIPCGLIVNEIITNAMKYAFEGIKNPILKVKLYTLNNTIHLHIEDNGIGLPVDFKADESDSLGLQLVYTLMDQLDGTITVNVNNGTKYLITFVKVES